MSHIPSSAMKHAGPVHDDSAAQPDTKHASTSAAGSGIGTGAWVAIGGTLLAGAAAAIALPLLRGRKAGAGRKSSARGGKKRKAGHAQKTDPA